MLRRDTQQMEYTLGRILAYRLRDTILIGAAIGLGVLGGLQLHSRIGARSNQLPVETKVSLPPLEKMVEGVGYVIRDRQVNAGPLGILSHKPKINDLYYVSADSIDVKTFEERRYDAIGYDNFLDFIYDEKSDGIPDEWWHNTWGGTKKDYSRTEEILRLAIIRAKFSD